MKHPINISHEQTPRILSFLFPVTVICLILHVFSTDMQKHLTASVLYQAMSPRFNYPLYPLLPMPVPSSWVQLQRFAASSVRYFYSFLLPLPKNKNKTTSAQTINISPPRFLNNLFIFHTLTTSAQEKKVSRGMKRHDFPFLKPMNKCKWNKRHHFCPNFPNYFAFRIPDAL